MMRMKEKKVLKVHHLQLPLLLLLKIHLLQLLDFFTVLFPDKVPLPWISSTEMNQRNHPQMQKYLVFSVKASRVYAVSFESMYQEPQVGLLLA
jgi:hypothetical protein